jgi:hypothetical protein
MKNFQKRLLKDEGEDVELHRYLATDFNPQNHPEAHDELVHGGTDASQRAQFLALSKNPLLVVWILTGNEFEREIVGQMTALMCFECGKALYPKESQACWLLDREMIGVLCPEARESNMPDHFPKRNELSADWERWQAGPRLKTWEGRRTIIYRIQSRDSADGLCFRLEAPLTLETIASLVGVAKSHLGELEGLQNPFSRIFP